MSGYPEEYAWICSTDFTPKQAAAHWWLKQMPEMTDEQKTAFIGSIEKDKELDGDCWTVATDYDPDDVLCRAVRAAGFECRGFGNSNRQGDLDLPYKTRVRFALRTLTVSIGYAGLEVVIGRWHPQQEG